MKPQRKIAQRPEEYTVSLRAWVVETLLGVALGALLGVALAVALAASGVRAGTIGGIALKATVFNPLKGTSTNNAVLYSFKYNGASPTKWTAVTTSGKTITGTMEGEGNIAEYYYVPDKGYTLSLKYTVWVPGRLYASGFEK